MTGAEPTSRAPSGAHPGSGWSCALASAWLPALVTVALSAFFIARTAFVVRGEVYFSLYDDAMISMRYGRSLAEGHGLVWNPGEHVEGYSNLLWTLWMAALHLARPSPAKASLLVMISGVAVLVLNVAVARRLVREIAPDAPLAVAVAGWLVALDHSLAYWTLRGFEVGILALGVSTAALLAIRLSKAWSRRTVAKLAAVMALGVLARDDSLAAWLVVIAYVAARAPSDRRWSVVLWLGGAVTAALLGHVLFRMAYYGAPLPNTYYLKMYRIPALFRWRRGVRALLDVALFCLPVSIGVVAGASVRRRRSAPMVFLGGLFLAECAYSIHVGGDAFEHELFVNRFLSTTLPVLCVVLAIGVDALLRDRERAPRRAWAVAACVLFVLAAAYNARILALRGGEEVLRGSRIAAALVAAVVAVRAHVRGGAGRGAAFAVVLAVTGPAQIQSLIRPPWIDSDTLEMRFAVALTEATRDDAVIAVTWAGALPYFSRRRTIDLLGKCDPVVARGPIHPGGHFAPGHNKWDLDHSIGVLRPDVVAGLPDVGAETLRRMESWGYERVGPDAFFRADSDAIDREALRRAACIVPWGIEDMWGYLGDPVELWRDRWARECGPLDR